MALHDIWHFTKIIVFVLLIIDRTHLHHAICACQLKLSAVVNFRYHDYIINT